MGSVVIRSTRVLTPSLTDKATTDATTTNTAGAGGRRELYKSHFQPWARGTGNGKYKYQNGGYMNYYNNNRNYYNSNYYNSNYYNNNNNNSNHYHNNYYNKNYYHYHNNYYN